MLDSLLLLDTLLVDSLKHSRKQAFFQGKGSLILRSLLLLLPLSPKLTEDKTRCAQPFYALSIPLVGNNASRCDEKDPKKPVYFKSLRSVGYLFEDPS